MSEAKNGDNHPCLQVILIKIKNNINFSPLPIMLVLD